MTRKGYKHTELGEIPEDWDVKTLRDAFDYIQPTTYLVSSTDYSSYGIPVLTAGKTFILGYTTEREGVFNDLPIVIFDDFTTESKYVTFSFKAKSSAMKMLKAKPNVDEYYAYLALQTVDYTVGGHKRHWISKFQYLPIPLPPLPEQRAIASVLSDVDALIEALDRLIDKKRKIKQGTMQQLLSGKKRLKGFGKGKGYKHTELGEIPEDWEVRQIGSFTTVQAGGTPSTKYEDYWNGDIRWMNSGELNLKRVHEVEGRITEIGLKASSTHLLPEYCVLIGLAGQGKTRGTTAINYVRLCTNQSIGAILPSKLHNPEFIYQIIDSMYLKLREMSDGGGGRGGLNLKILNNLNVVFPPLPEQRAIASVLSDMDAEIEALEAKRKKYTKIKQGMMQDLLTGRVRLPVKEV